MRDPFLKNAWIVFFVCAFLLLILSICGSVSCVVRYIDDGLVKAYSFLDEDSCEIMGLLEQELLGVGWHEIRIHWEDSEGRHHLEIHHELETVNLFGKKVWTVLVYRRK